MGDDQEDIRARAGELFSQAFRDAGWTGSDFSTYSGWRIREAVTAIAAGGEQAAMRLILSMFLTRIPRSGTVNGRADGELLDRCMTVIQQARTGQFPGNTGWTWDGENRRWTARRGTALVTAAFPRDQMPPVPADLFAVQLAGGNYHGAVVQVMEDPGEANLPWGCPVLAEIPVQPGTADWYRGLRGWIYLGRLCSPCGRTDSRVCLQPDEVLQAGTPCVPVDPDHVRLLVLDGKLSDYS